MRLERVVLGNRSGRAYVRRETTAASACSDQRTVPVRSAIRRPGGISGFSSMLRHHEEQASSGAVSIPPSRAPPACSRPVPELPPSPARSSMSTPATGSWTCDPRQPAFDETFHPFVIAGSAGPTPLQAQAGSDRPATLMLQHENSGTAPRKAELSTAQNGEESPVIHPSQPCSSHPGIEIDHPLGRGKVRRPPRFDVQPVVRSGTTPASTRHRAGSERCRRIDDHHAEERETHGSIRFRDGSPGSARFPPDGSPMRRIRRDGGRSRNLPGSVPERPAAESPGAPGPETPAPDSLPRRRSSRTPVACRHGAGSGSGSSSPLSPVR